MNKPSLRRGCRTMRQSAAISMLSLLVLILMSSPAMAQPLEVVRGRPVLREGRRLLGSAYSETYPWDGRFHHRNRQFASVGVDLLILCVMGMPDADYVTTAFWRGPGAFADEADLDHDRTLDSQARAILEVNPNARFLVRWLPTVPRGWAQAHPGEMEQSGGEFESSLASIASRKANEGMAEMGRRIVRYCEQADWGDRVIGYAMLPMGEGFTDLAIHGYLFDQAPAMQQALVAWLARTYDSDAALQRAWSDPSATRDTAAVPTMAQWHADRKTWMHWPEPAQTQRYRDYFLCVRELFFEQVRTLTSAVQEAATRPVVIAYDGLKQPMLGWLIGDAFFAKAAGTDFPSMHLAAGSIDIGPLLDHPDLHAIITPADYTARSVGFGFDPEGPADSVPLRGKLMLIEDDARSWATKERATQGAWRNLQEAQAGLLRNSAIALSRGMFNYWMNIGGGYYDDDAIMAHVATQVPLRETLQQQPWAPTEHAIAMIIDDASPLEEDFTSGFQHLASLRQRVDELARTGLPHRVYLLSDLQRDDFPHYRAYLFPNLFRLTPERIALIREKCLRSGAIAIFGPGTGITDGRHRTAELASELLGFPLELVEKEVARRVLVHAGTHPALAELPSAVTYGDSFVYGPILQPAADLGSAVELGKASMWWQNNRAGLVLREFGRGAGPASERAAGDAAVVFSVATPMPASLLRSLALYAGCNRWSDLGDVVAASDSMVAVHTTRPGKRTVHLPQKRHVLDMQTGQWSPQAVDAFEMELESPETRIFMLQQDPPAVTTNERPHMTIPVPG